MKTTPLSLKAKTNIFVVTYSILVFMPYFLYDVKLWLLCLIWTAGFGLMVLVNPFLARTVENYRLKELSKDEPRRILFYENKMRKSGYRPYNLGDPDNDPSQYVVWAKSQVKAKLFFFANIKQFAIKNRKARYYFVCKECHNLPKYNG